jgi:hypothetical protein
MCPQEKIPDCTERGGFLGTSAIARRLAAGHRTTAVDMVTMRQCPQENLF